MNDIKSLIEDGLSISKIALKLNLPAKTISEEIEKHGYKLKRESFDDSKIDRIIELYCSGVSAKSLGKKYSIDKRRVQKWVKEKGKLRSIEESHRTTLFNEHKMDVINDPAKAYWLGFFYADAYNGDLVNTFNITLMGSDIGHCKKIARFFDLPEGKAERHTTNNGIDTANIKLYSKHLCNKMTELGCPRAKSLILTYPEWMLDNLHSHFVRGLFDGDGCLTFRANNKEWKWSFAGTKEVCDKICDIITILGIHKKPYYISKTNSNTYAVEITGNEQITKMCDWLYDGSNEEIRLNRKYSLYLNLKQQQDNRSFLKSKSFLENATRTSYNIPMPTSNNVTHISTNFINEISANCLLGQMAKDVVRYDNLMTWRVNKKHHFVVIDNHPISNNEIEYLKQFSELSFHYLSHKNIEILGKHCSVTKDKLRSIILTIDGINYSGKKNSTIRNYMNRYKDLDIRDNADIIDIEKMLDRWSNTLGEKYFRNFVGKNRFFFKNEFHKNCENVFVYDQDKLVAFGVASSNESNIFSYVIGKALAKDYPGLSEFTDMKLYELLYSKYGEFRINMGQATNGLLFYKKKFPNSVEEIHYNGKVKF